MSRSEVLPRVEAEPRCEEELEKGKGGLEDGAGVEMLAPSGEPLVREREDGDEFEEDDDTEAADEDAEDAAEAEEEVASDAFDTDGLRERRQRLSLDDIKVRSQPNEENAREKTDADKDSIDEDDADEAAAVAAPDAPEVVAEGRVVLDPECPIPIVVGTCGKAGWEPLRGANRRSIEVRKENQDAYLALKPLEGMPGQAVLGVFDGHGAAGRKISQAARDSITQTLQTAQRSDPVLQRQIVYNSSMTDQETAEIHRKRAELLRGAFQSVETELLSPERDVDPKYSGTTAVLTWILETDLYCAWVGDSRAVIGRSAGRSVGNRFKVIELTHDQKPLRSDERKRVKAAGGRVARWRKDVGPLRVWVPTEWIPGLAMTRSIGDTVLTSYGVLPNPEITYYRLSAQDSFLILASDGVWEFMSSQEAVDFVAAKRRDNAPPATAADGLVREAVKRWRKNETVVDDTTAIVVYLNFSNAEGAPEPSRSLFSFGKSSSGPKPQLVSSDGKLASFTPKNDIGKTG